ncbi:MAG: PVC-type heme-binding CxxCH protein [Maribacter sp.]|uniref:PVC-type heme-binding CxxCH protein n=1 Tax=Maribacter sp. TaxID=1897614 RepID=UPI0032972597
MKNFQLIFLRLLLPFLFVLGCNSETKKRALPDDQPRRIELLFLGHEMEHHNSSAYFPILATALTKDGINITYTEDVNDLNTENLNLYDGLIVYANHESINPSQEQTLLDFVSTGNAFIPIHSASFCFKNSPKYIDLVGAQFKEHDTLTFSATITNTTHPLMENVTEFEAWDETYVHDKIADDITVLMERVEGDHSEPWTWVKEYGKGKVFYTASGHDERVWNHTGFQNLIREGILWAVDANTKNNWEAFAATIPTLKYEDRTGIPNYEKRDPAPKYQLPLSPEESEKLIQVPAGFDLQLFASEPEIVNPIAMNWDEKGRLWVIETVDYPNTVRDELGIGDDRVKILEDTDGDGRADKVTVFAEKLNIPTSFAFYDGGIIVSQAPQFLFLKDTDGDDKADIRETIIDGWGVSDTHAGPSNLQYGIDNSIYGVVGYSGFEGSIYDEVFDFSQNMYRFNPKKKYFEVLTNTSNNTWGLGITEDNSLFASTANNTHSVFLGIPNYAMEGIEGITAQGSLKIDGHYDMMPITKNYRQVDVFGGFTAAAGHHFYTARNYPKQYWNKVAFVCEPTGGLVHIAKIEKNGAGYIEKDGGNLFASSDEWVSPVEAKVGPDGNVWIADWYNFIVQHNPTPTESFGGFKGENGQGNAYVNPLRDKSRGRIWRVVPKIGKLQNSLGLDKENPEELVRTLAHQNMFWRLTAQRLLIERGDTDVLPALYKLVTDMKVDALGLNAGALHALWTIDGLGALGLDTQGIEIVTGALLHPAAAVRKAAIQILPKNRATDNYLNKVKILNDKDASVRLVTFLYYTKRPASEAIGARLYTVSKQESITSDNWLSKGLYAAANKHGAGFMKQYAEENPNIKVDTAPQTKRHDIDLDDSNWKTMELPQYIEDAGLDIDGVIWFRRNFTLNTDASTYVSLGPIDDSDIVYINGIQVGLTENEYAKNRYYDIPVAILNKGKNTIAVRVEDTGSGGGIYGTPNQMYIRSGNTTVSLSGSWRYEVETDFAESANNAFGGTSIAAVFAKNYKKVDKATEPDITTNDQGRVITMKTIQNEMKYDLSEFVVKAGETVTLVFENNDFMQHNLLILAEGSMEKVGAAADKLAQDPNAADSDYIPIMPEVLHATKLVNPNAKVTIRFTAPEQAGEYPYICTFPGHWRIMQGVMKVVK